MELSGEDLDKFPACQRGVRQIHTVHPLGLRPDRRVDQRRLAQTCLAEQQGHPLAADNRVLEVAERLAVRRDHDEEPGIGHQIEGPFTKAEEFLVHGRQATKVYTTMARQDATVAPSPQPRTILRRISRRRSSVDCIKGTTASTFTASTAAISSSVLKLASRYSRNPMSAAPRAKPPNNPPRVISRRSGLNGLSGSRAWSRSLNCSPICRRSRLAAIFDCSFFSRKLWSIVCSVEESP